MIAQQTGLKQEGVNEQRSALYSFPVSIFSAVMGTAGLSRAFRLAEGLIQIGRYWSIVSGIIAWLIFIIVLLVFLLKVSYFPSRVLAEFFDPVAGRFYATIPISILLLSAVTMPYARSAAFYCWISGALLMISLTFITIYNLLSRPHKETDFEPAMILPAVGILNVAQTGSFMHNSWVKELNTFSLAVGAVLTVVFFVIIFLRLIRLPRLTEKMEPTLMILLSPFGVCFLAYEAVTGKVDLFAVGLFYFGLFLFMILTVRIFAYQRSFKYTWWSLGFPVAALTNSAFKYAFWNHQQVSVYIAFFLLLFLGLLIVFMLFKSLYLLISGIC